MSNEPAAIGSLPGVPDARAIPTLSPYLVRVIVPFHTGTVDEAVREAGKATEAAIANALLPVFASIETNRRRARLAALILG